MRTEIQRKFTRAQGQGPNFGDGMTSEIPTSLIDHFEFYLLNYFKPATVGRGQRRALRSRRAQHKPDD